MSKAELIELARRIMDGNETESEQEHLMDLFSANVPHPDGATLIYWPANYNFRSDNHSNYDPTPEEVVEQALNYKPIAL